MTKNKSRPLALLAAGLLWVSLAEAQESANTSGGNVSGSGGNAAYSVGQVVYTTNTSTTGTESQGVQQAYEIFYIGINETEMNISLSFFPNPAADNLTMQIKEYNSEKLSYQLYDMQSKLINNGQVTSQQTQINTASLPSATYFIQVSNQENKIIQSFKIVKN